MNELDGGKKINSRSYLILLRAEALPRWIDRQLLRVGSRVPYATGTGAGSNTIQYQDVAMNIDCRLLPMGNGKVAIDTKWEYSSVGASTGLAMTRNSRCFDRS